MEDFHVSLRQSKMSHRQTQGTYKKHRKCLCFFSFLFIQLLRCEDVMSETNYFNYLASYSAAAEEIISNMILWITVTSFPYAISNMYMVTQGLIVINYISIRKILIYQASWVTIFQKNNPSLIIYFDGGMLISTSAQLHSFHEG